MGQHDGVREALTELKSFIVGEILVGRDNDYKEGHTHALEAVLDEIDEMLEAHKEEAHGDSESE